MKKVFGLGFVLFLLVASSCSSYTCATYVSNEPVQENTRQDVTL